ncbi:copper transporter [Desulfoscipio geothermicus]|uniref:Copper transport outer membrane protein, MctB n=1 Tax=Desulfoscipio geothermicus DSM 3669 TaxID=1121426 RepID=A0A1I6DAS8_9FIRM|nr:copper transporter [Desulfoscipio geothermicus]SFR02544.1 Copper transport outer membrane protein, MctB [Desulfoscipio geothermicus DSM 3669]
MIVDYKYHIASLVAVFLALGIGILIGSTLLGNDALIDYQKQVTDRLENQLQSLRETNEAIQARANTLEIDANMHKQFEKQVLPVLMAGKLAEKKFALVELNSYGFPPELTEAIASAGGQVSSITSVSTLYDDKQALEKLQQELGWEAASGEKLIGRLATEIADGIVTGENPAVVNSLAENEIIKTSGEYGIPVDGVIIVGGSYRENKRNIQIDIAFINYFQDLNIPVVGVEETDVAYSTMKEYQRKHVSTVDNIDTAPGQLALVLALSGKPGHYGVKSTAQTLLPELEKREVK